MRTDRSAKPVLLAQGREPLAWISQLVARQACVLLLAALLAASGTKTGSAQGTPGRYDGEYYNEEYDFGFRIEGNVGICTKSNASTYAVGDVMFRFTASDSGRFEGQQIFTDGQWYDVWGQFLPNRIEMRHGVMVWWTMTMTAPSQLPPSSLAPSQAATQHRLDFDARNGNQIIADILNDRRVWGLGGPICQILNSPANGSLPSVSAISAMMHDLLQNAGSSGSDLAMLHFGRIANQAFKIPYSEMGTAGWKKSDPDETAFHITNVPDASRVEKWVHDDGREYVFYDDPSKGIVQLNDGQNDGTFNFALSGPHPASGVKHIVLDVLPWILHGATPEDTTSINQRLDMFVQSEKFKKFRLGLQAMCADTI